MKGNKQTYQSIEDIVDGVCLDLGEGMHRKEQYLHWALKEVDKWKMDGAKEVKTVQLPLTSWKSIQLPKDCIDWIKVGIQDGDVIKAFVNKNDIAIIHDTDTLDFPIVNDDPTSIPDFSIDTTQAPLPFYNLLNPWGNPGKIFGQQVKDNGFGYFIVNRNEDTDEIQFKTKVDSSSKIYLEYLADGWNPTSQTAVHPYACELVSLGVHYRRLKFDKSNGKRSISTDDVRTAKIDYQEEFDRVVFRMWDLSTEDIIETLSNGYMLVPNQPN
jgi:hypothetical protein